MKGHDIYNKSAWIRYTLIGSIVVWVVAYLIAGKIKYPETFRASRRFVAASGDEYLDGRTNTSG
jgi:hypothetical protein